MAKNTNISLKYSLDWVTVFIYLAIVIFGWMNIYGASYDFDDSNIFDFSQRAGKQFVWILTALGIGGILLLIDYKLYSVLGYIIYGLILLLLILTIFIAKDIKGSRSWLVFGPVSFQPAELAKMATALALSKFISDNNVRIKEWKDMLPLLAIIFIPAALIVVQKETGGALVFLALLLVLYREGMNGIVLILGAYAVALFIVVIRFSIVDIQVDESTWGIVLGMILILAVEFFYVFFLTRHTKEGLWLLAGVVGVALIVYGVNRLGLNINYEYAAIGVVLASCVYWVVIEIFKRYKKYRILIIITLGALLFSFSADYLFNDILQPHQQSRIKVLLGMEEDKHGAGYNVNQSKIAIGSGGFAGKGYLNGTQTKLKYVPEQDTDFIFCTVGEEWGFVGSTLLLIMYWALLMRILKIAERQREKFNQVYAYCVASILFFHLMINVGMVIGIMPVIGIPLPFLSYGGSSLWSFTILLFILLRLDASRLERGIHR